MALAVDDAAARDMLETCASGPEHFFEAANTAGLIAAFGRITNELTHIRLGS